MPARITGSVTIEGGCEMGSESFQTTGRRGQAFNVAIQRPRRRYWTESSSEIVLIRWDDWIGLEM
jgi:hypothetical protein